jgi:hypothetical protein
MGSLKEQANPSRQVFSFLSPPLLHPTANNWKSQCWESHEITVKKCTECGHMKCDKCMERNRKAPAAMEADREFSEWLEKSGLGEYKEVEGFDGPGSSGMSEMWTGWVRGVY